MSDYEIENIISFCFDLFGQPIKGLHGYTYILKQKFSTATDKKIIKLVSEYVSNTSSELMQRFSPALLSFMLRQSNKEKFPDYTHNNYETSSEEKEKYKQMFLDALYADFEDYCQRIKPTRIFIWDFVCRKLKDKGVILEKEYSGAFEINTKRQSRTQKASELFNGFRELCLLKFKDMAMTGKHIKEFI